MSKRPKTVDHLGKVQEITHNDVLVSIINKSACAGCHAKNVCGIADSNEKIVAVRKPNHHYTIGQEVKVVLKQSLGFKAMFLGYMLPFMVVLTTLLILISLDFSEGLSGLISLFILVPYYFTLYFFRDSISKHFTFDIESI
jgi:sigma-E factor negative regulatory protein RseC